MYTYPVESKPVITITAEQNSGESKVSYFRPVEPLLVVREFDPSQFIDMDRADIPHTDPGDDSWRTTLYVSGKAIMHGDYYHDKIDSMIDGYVKCMEDYQHPYVVEPPLYIPMQDNHIQNWTGEFSLDVIPKPEED